jgi:O-antigen/teichoic acid export membrane protein
MLCTEVPVLLLGSFYGAAVVGWYVLAQRILSRPLEILAGAANHIYLGSGAAALRDRPAQLPALFRTLVRALFVSMTPYVAALALLAPTVFPRLFGPGWAEAALYVRILAPMVLLRMVATTVQDTLEVFQRQNLSLARELIRITTLFAVAVVIARFVPNPAHGLALFSVAGCANYLLSIAMSAYAMKTFVTHHAAATTRATEDPCYG